MNRKNLTAAVLAGLAGVAGIAGVATAQTAAPALNMNPDGLGEVLIYPYYTTRDGQQTLVSVVNTTDEAKAVKVRFKEGYNSREALDFNLYLSKYDVWVGSVAEMDGVPTLLVPDTSCTVPYFYGSDEFYNEEMDRGEVAFLDLDFTGDYEDGGPTELSRTAEGYIEIIEMGEMTGEDGRAKGTLSLTDPGRLDSATAATHVRIEDEETGEISYRPADCGLLVRNWTVYRGAIGNAQKLDPWDGWWADEAFNPTVPDGDYSACSDYPSVYPTRDDISVDGCGHLKATESVGASTGGLFGGAAVVNGGEGTMYSYDAQAIQGFNTTEEGLHFYPGNSHPGLNDGNVTSAVVFLGLGQQATLSYERGVDAVSAVFMHDELNNTFTIEDGINAASEWIFTFPTKSFYVDPVVTGVTIEWTPDPDDAGCNGWDPGEEFPPRTGPDYPDDIVGPVEDHDGWETCTYIKDSDQNEAYAPFTELFYGDACERVSLAIWNREESPPPLTGDVLPPVVSPAPDPEEGTETVFDLCYEVNTLRFGEETIFGSAGYEDGGLALEVSNVPENGWTRITFGGGDAVNDSGTAGECVSCDRSGNEQHIDDNDLRGLPVTGFAAERYMWGDVAGAGVRANYGGLFRHKGSVRLCGTGDECASD